MVAVKLQDSVTKYQKADDRKIAVLTGAQVITEDSLEVKTQH